MDLFFVLSGFLISGLLFSEYKKRKAISFKRFFIRRGLKIYPAFYVFLLVTGVASIRWFHSLAPPTLFLNEIFFVMNYLGGVWTHTWSLGVEEHFYILLPIFLSILIRYSSDRDDPFRILPRACLVVGHPVHSDARDLRLHRGAQLRHGVHGHAQPHGCAFLWRLSRLPLPFPPAHSGEASATGGKSDCDCCCFRPDCFPPLISFLETAGSSPRSDLRSRTWGAREFSCFACTCTGFFLPPSPALRDDWVVCSRTSGCFRIPSICGRGRPTRGSRPGCAGLHISVNAYGRFGSLAGSLALGVGMSKLVEYPVLHLAGSPVPAMQEAPTEATAIVRACRCSTRRAVKQPHRNQINSEKVRTMEWAHSFCEWT